MIGPRLRGPVLHLAIAAPLLAAGWPAAGRAADAPAARGADAPAARAADASVARGADAPVGRDRTEAWSRESDNQTRVSGELGQLVAELDELVGDVTANEAYARAEGESLDGIKEALRGTNRDRVLVAAAALRRAVAAAGAGATHVREAGRQVREAREELTRLLRQANALLLQDTIGQEVRELLQAQQDLARRTAEVARARLQEQPPPADPAQLAQEQRQLARRVKQLAAAFAEALQEELPDEAREQLQRAQELAEEQQLAELEQQAVDELDRDDPAAAFEAQQRAQEVLAEMAAEVSADRGPSAAELAALQDALQRQQALREQTAALSPEDFAQQAAELQLAQLNLARDLPPDSPAAAAMAEAAAQLERAAQQPAVAAQEAAEAALGAALEEALGPGPGVPGAKGESGSDDRGDGDSDRDEEGRGGKGKGKRGRSRRPGPPAEGGESQSEEPGPEGQPEENASLQPALATNRPGRVAGEPRPGERLFEKTAVEGRAPAAGVSTWSPLSDRERDALAEQFARELPREYREMLKAYFEELSR